MVFFTKVNLTKWNYIHTLSYLSSLSILPINQLFVPVTLSKQLRYDLTLIAVIFIWGANFPILKQVLHIMHPFVVNAIRFTFSIASIVTILLISGNARTFFSAKTLLKNRSQLIPLGILGYFFYQVFFILGIENTTAGNSALLMASVPAWTAIVGVFFTRESLSLKAICGLIVSIIGTVIIVVSGTKTIDTGSELLIGNILIIIAALCWGGYTALSRPVTRTIDPIHFTLYGLLLSFPLNLAISIPYLQDVHWGDVTFSSWCSIIYSGGLSTGIAVVLWIYVVRHAGATHTAVFGNLVPVVALVGSYFFLHEAINLGQLIGGAIIILGILLMRLKRISFSGKNA